MSNKDNNGIKRWAILSGIGIQMGVIIYLFVKAGNWLDTNYIPEGKKCSFRKSNSSILFD